MRARHTAWCGLFILMSLCVGSAAGQGLSPCPQAGAAFDFDTLTVSTTAVGLTAAKVDLANAAYMTLEGTNGIRWRIDGQVPTATVGHLFEPPGTGSAGSGSGMWLCGRNSLLSLRMIRASTADVTIRVTYTRSQ